MLRIGGADGLLMSLAGEIAEADINPVIVAESGAVAADARFILSAGAAAGQDASGADADRDAPGARTSLETFRPLFEPKTVAVIGASTKAVSIRSEERRVGKECAMTSRSRWSPLLKKKNHNSESNTRRH